MTSFLLSGFPNSFHERRRSETNFYIPRRISLLWSFLPLFFFFSKYFALSFYFLLILCFQWEVSKLDLNFGILKVWVRPRASKSPGTLLYSPSRNQSERASSHAISKTLRLSGLKEGVLWRTFCISLLSPSLQRIQPFPHHWLSTQDGVQRIHGSRNHWNPDSRVRSSLDHLYVSKRERTNSRDADWKFLGHSVSSLLSTARSIRSWCPALASFNFH